MNARAETPRHAWMALGNLQTARTYLAMAVTALHAVLDTDECVDPREPERLSAEAKLLGDDLVQFEWLARELVGKTALEHPQ